MISDFLIERYRELYRTHYGIEISKEQALMEGMALVNLFKIILKYKNQKPIDDTSQTEMEAETWSKS